MTSIFVSHSQKDTKIRDFFGTVFATTKVKAIFKEIEGFSSTSQSSEIKRNIQDSKAVFILLGKYVQKLSHTRDWVISESGIAEATDKDIWVFEPLSLLGKIDVIIPHLNHYAIYKMDDHYRQYFRKIVNYYDQSDHLPAALIGGAVGGLTGTLIEALIPKKSGFTGIGALIGALLGGTGGLIWADSTRKQPSGRSFKCPQCENSYIIHMELKKIRCPICNSILKINWDAKNGK